MEDRLISEAEVLKALNLKTSDLARLRSERGLPYVRVSRIKRLYLLSSLLEWAKENISKSDPG